MAKRFGCEYLVRAFDDIGGIVQKVKEIKWLFEVDTFVGRGLSGALVVPHVARACGKQWAIVRKNDDGSHSSSTIEGDIGNKWLFVDDLVCTGSTFKSTFDEIKLLASWSRCRGLYLYRDDIERVFYENLYGCTYAEPPAAYPAEKMGMLSGIPARYDTAKSLTAMEAAERFPIDIERASRIAMEFMNATAMGFSYAQPSAEAMKIIQMPLDTAVQEKTDADPEFLHD